MGACRPEVAAFAERVLPCLKSARRLSRGLRERFGALRVASADGAAARRRTASGHPGTGGRSRVRRATPAYGLVPVIEQSELKPMFGPALSIEKRTAGAAPLPITHCTSAISANDAEDGPTLTICGAPR